MMTLSTVDAVAADQKDVVTSQQQQVEAAAQLVGLQPGNILEDSKLNLMPEQLLQTVQAAPAQPPPPPPQPVRPPPTPFQNGKLPWAIKIQGRKEIATTPIYRDFK